MKKPTIKSILNQELDEFFDAKFGQTFNVTEIPHRTFKGTVSKCYSIYKSKILFEKLKFMYANGIIINVSNDGLDGRSKYIKVVGCIKRKVLVEKASTNKFDLTEMEDYVYN